MSVLTVEKKRTELCFNNKRSCGLWLTLVGVVLMAGLALGGKFLINPIVFLAGYYISFYIANINKKVRAKLSQGSASKFQIKMIFVSIAFMFLMMFCIAGPYIPSMNWRMIWLGVNLATGCSKDHIRCISSRIRQAFQGNTVRYGYQQGFTLLLLNLYYDKVIEVFLLRETSIFLCSEGKLWLSRF